MASDISDMTGEIFYSGTFEDISKVLAIFEIDEGKLATLKQETVNDYQEMVDREIDAILEELYHTPLISKNVMQPDGVVRALFPGDIRRHARYWTASLLLLNEFQQLSQNTTDQASTYIEDSRRQIFAMKNPTHRIPNQERKSNISRTMPPNMQPPALPQQDY